MFNWLKALLRKLLESPNLPDTSKLDVPIRYVNTRDVSFGANFPGYFRICMNLETGKVTREHIGGTHITDEITELDCQLAYDGLPDKYKPKYRQFLEKMNVKIQF